MAETRTPSTLVEPGGTRTVRLDVRDLVRNWGKHDRSEHGVAVVAEGDSRTGTTFALRAVGADQTTSTESGSGVRAAEARIASAPDVEPYLELYVR